MKAPNPKGVRTHLDHERDQALVSLYRQGKTLKEIGDAHSLSRERVRKIMRRNGVTKKDGGHHMRALMRREAK